jgi:uncharacterized SAM-binding protein YcdF (DUF218 family)
MLPGELKPILTALVLPPAGPLLLALFGVLVATRRRALGLVLATLGIAATFALSTNGMALVLARVLMPEVRPATAAELQAVQAIVVLGGGVRPDAAEYGAAQPSEATLQRLRYGARLARQAGKPLAFAGGLGWGASGLQVESEAVVARRTLQEDYGLPVRWQDDSSRDTAENARNMAPLLQREGIRRIALVTDATHMPRAAPLFRAAGFEVVPAPTDFPGPRNRPLLEWLPSSHGASLCRTLLREWLGRMVMRSG